MVYALLHRQDVFEPFRMHARFADILDNIQVGILGFASWQSHCIMPLHIAYCPSTTLAVPVSHLYDKAADRVKAFLSEL